MELILKNIVMAEIERRIEALKPRGGQGLVVTKILKDHYEDFRYFLNTLEVKDAKEWRTDTPQGSIVVAKIAENFCHNKECYEVLRFYPMPYPHYSDYWEEVPYSAIEKWLLIKQ